MEFNFISSFMNPIQIQTTNGLSNFYQFIKSHSVQFENRLILEHNFFIYYTLYRQFKTTDRYFV